MTTYLVGGHRSYPGNPEGYAVDAKRGRFYTNLEDKDRTVAIDLKTHETVATRIVHRCFICITRQ